MTVDFILAAQDAKRRYGLAQRHIWVPMSSRATPATNNLSNGTDTGANTVLRSKMPASGYDPRAVFGGFYNSGGVETDYPNAYRLRAAFYYNSHRFPITFNGNPDTMVYPGTIVTSDPAAFSFAVTDNVSVISYITVASGEQWALGMNAVIANGEGSDHAAITPTDKTRTGTLPTSAERIFTPVALTARLVYPGQRVIGVVGDSIMAGAGDTLGDLGWVRRWLNDQYCVQYCAMTSATVPDWMQTSGSTAYRQMRLLENCTDVIIGLGINGISDPSTLTNVQTLAGRFTGRGQIVHVATLLPSGSNETSRVTYNDAIRAHPSWITGQVLDIATLVETSLDSGTWKNGYTDGAPHPNATGAAAIAAGLAAPTTIFGAIGR